MAIQRPPLSLPFHGENLALAASVALLQHAVTQHNQLVDSAAGSFPDAAAALNGLAIDPTTTLGLSIVSLFANAVVQIGNLSREMTHARQTLTHQKAAYEQRLREQQEFHERERAAHERERTAHERERASNEQLFRQQELAEEATLEVLRSELRHRELLLAHHQATWGGSMHETQSPAEVWKRRKLLEHPTTYTPVPHAVLPEGLPELMSDCFTAEKDIYPKLATFLAQQMHGRHVGIHRNAVQTVVTAHKRFLFNRAPDLVLQASPVSEASPAPSSQTGPLAPNLVIVPIEIKYPLGDPLAESDKGQLLDQLYRLMRLQPWRQVAMGWLTSLEHNCWIEVRQDPASGPNMFTAEISGCSTFGQALSFLLNHVLQDDRQIPSFPAFSPCFTMMEKVLGITQTSFVARFQKLVMRGSGAPTTRQSEKSPSVTLTWIEDVSKQSVMAVKRVHKEGITLAREIAVLRDISTAATTDPCPYLPRLLAFDAVHNLEIVMNPVGKPVYLPELLSTPSIAVSVMQNIFDALLWLHSHRWIHRDVRWENIVVSEGRGVLLDLGCAIEIPSEGEEKVDVPYLGGFICCPLRVIQEPDPLANATYRPKVADDYAAFVLLVVVLLFSRSFEQIPFAQIGEPKSMARRFLLRLWNALQASSTWGEYAGLVTKFREEGERSQDPKLFSDIRKLPEAILAVPDRSIFARGSAQGSGLVSPTPAQLPSASPFGTSAVDEDGYIAVVTDITRQLGSTLLEDDSDSFSV